MSRRHALVSLNPFDALECKLSMSGVVVGAGIHVHPRDLPPPEPDPGPLPTDEPPIILPPMPPSGPVGPG